MPDEPEEKDEDVQIVEEKEDTANFNELKERVQELEDLLLLIEMENTQLKEKIVGSANLETPVEVLSRLQKLEERVATAKEDDTGDLEKKISNAEEYLGKELAELDKRLARLEERVFHRAAVPERKAPGTPQRYEEEESDILEEVQKILKG